MENSNEIIECCENPKTYTAVRFTGPTDEYPDLADGEIFSGDYFVSILEHARYVKPGSWILTPKDNPLKRLIVSDEEFKKKFTPLSEKEDKAKELEDYRNLTRANFNNIWNRLQACQLMADHGTKEQLERELVDVKDVANYCVHHGSTQQHAEWDTLKVEIETIKDLRAKLAEAEKYLMHKVDCNLNFAWHKPECTCGLDDFLKSIKV